MSEISIQQSEEEIKLDLRFRGDSTGNKEDLAIDEYLTKRFIEATNGTSVNYIQKAYINDSDPMVADAKSMSELQKFLRDFTPGSDRREFNELIDQVYSTIESKDIVLQTTKGKMDEGAYSHDTMMDRHYSIVKRIQSIKQEANSVDRKLERFELEDLSSRMCKAIEEETSLIPINYQKVDESIIEMIKVVILDRDHEADKLVQRIEVVDMTKKYYKREEICKLIYQHYRNNLRDNRDQRNTLRSEMMNDNVSMMDISSFATGLDTNNPNHNPYAAKLNTVKEDINSLYNEILSKSNDIKVDLNMFRIKFSKYKESDQAMKAEILSNFEQIYKKSYDLHELFNDILVKDFCLGFGLMAKSRLFINRRIQVLVKKSIQQFALLNESTEYLYFMENAEKHMGERISIFNDKYFRLIRKVHKINSEEYLFRRFDDMDEKNPIEVFKEVEVRCKQVENILASAEDEIVICVRRMKTGASKSRINHLIYESYANTILLNTAKGSSKLEELRNFTNYHFDPKVWRTQRKTIENLNLVINLLEKEKNETQNKPTDKQIEKMSKMLHELKIERVNLGSRYTGIKSTGREGRQFLYSYSEFMRKLLDKADTNIKKFDYYLLSLKTGQQLSYTSNFEVDKEKVQNYLRTMTQWEDKIKFFTYNSSSIPPWNNYEQNMETLKDIDSEYQSISYNQEIEELFTSVGRAADKEQNYYNKIFRDQLEDLLDMNKQLHQSLGTLAIVRLKNNLQRYRPLDSFSEKTLRNWKEDKLIPEIENLQSGIISQRLSKINKYDENCCIKIAELIKLYREIAKFMVNISDQLLDLHQTSAETEIQRKINKIKKDCNDFKIKSFSRALYYEVIDPCVVQHYR